MTESSKKKKDVHCLIRVQSNEIHKFKANKPKFICGRALESDILFLETFVSRKHCIFFHDAETGETFIEDFKNSSYIYVNGKFQKNKNKIELKANDLIHLGKRCESAALRYSLKSIEDIESRDSDLEVIFDFQEEPEKDKSDVEAQKEREVKNVSVPKEKSKKKPPLRKNKDSFLEAMLKGFSDDSIEKSDFEDDPRIGAINQKIARPDASENKTNDENSDHRDSQNVLLNTKNEPDEIPEYNDYFNFNVGDDYKHVIKQETDSESEGMDVCDDEFENDYHQDKIQLEEMLNSFSDDEKKKKSDIDEINSNPEHCIPKRNKRSKFTREKIKIEEPPIKLSTLVLTKLPQQIKLEELMKPFPDDKPQRNSDSEESIMSNNENNCQNLETEKITTERPPLKDVSVVLTKIPEDYINSLQSKHRNADFSTKNVKKPVVLSEISPKRKDQHLGPRNSALKNFKIPLRKNTDENETIDFEGEQWIPINLQDEFIDKLGAVKSQTEKSRKRTCKSHNSEEPHRKMSKEDERLEKIKRSNKKQEFINRVNARRKTILNMSLHSQIEDFLLEICKWNPLWIEEQNQIKGIDPPVIDYNTLIPLLTVYKSFDDYFKIMKPVILLEIWHNIISECINGEKKKPLVWYSIVPKSLKIEQTPIQKYTFQVDIIVNREDFENQNFPTKGELLEITCTWQGHQVRVFGYIMQIQKSVITPKIPYNKELERFVRAPYARIRFTINTKKLESDPKENDIGTLKPIIYLRSIMKQVLALKVLPSSALKNFILKPNVDDFYIPNLRITNDDEELFTGDTLNAKQLEAVKKAKLIFHENEPKICLIQGPPGTGKSKVIVNILMEFFSESKKLPNKPTILVCAPSNVAVDEIAIRLLRVQQELPDERKFRLVRIGRSDAVHPNVKDILAINLAKKELSSYSGRNKVKNGYRVTSGQNSKNGKDELYNQERRILKEAHIIAGTLNSCFTNMMESVFGSDGIPICIVDEATQCCETEALIPLMLGVKKLILVGDSNQLPATTFSQRAKALGLDQSLFSRIQSAFKGAFMSPVITLNTQYRMVDSIVKWPNFYFYDNILTSSVSNNYNTILKPYLMLNLNAKQTEQKFMNVEETTFVINLVGTIISIVSCATDPINIGVITPYNDQKNLIQQCLEYGASILNGIDRRKFTVDVNTIDGFQGQERDIIIMSCVRSSGIGFLNDRHRLCVALTRAKYCFYICGNFSTFRQDPMWKLLIEDAERRGHFLKLGSNICQSQLESCIRRYQY